MAPAVYAQAASTAKLPHGVTESIGQGEGACPARSLCLYENRSLNASGKARIWSFAIGDGLRHDSLIGTPVWDVPTSAYLNAPTTGPVALLYADKTCGFFPGQGREAEAIAFTGGRRLDSLDKVNGRAKRYGYFSNKGKWTKDKRWGITIKPLNLNKRAGCVTTAGEFRDASLEYPSVDGSM